MTPENIVLVFCLLVSSGFGLRVFDQCKPGGAACPEDSQCTFRGCDGRICICNADTLPTANHTRCRKGTFLGDTCDGYSVCTGAPFSECREGKCQCKDGYYSAKFGDRSTCFPNLYNSQSAQYINCKVADQNDNDPCPYDLECNNGKCACPQDQRPATQQEIAASPYLYYLCRPKNFRLDEEVDLNGPTCIDKASPSTLKIQTPPSTTIEVTTITTTTTKATTTSTPKPTTSTTTITTPKPTTSTTTTTTPKPTTSTTTTTSTTLKPTTTLMPTTKPTTSSSTSTVTPSTQTPSTTKLTTTTTTPTTTSTTTTPIPTSTETTKPTSTSTTKAPTTPPPTTPTMTPATTTTLPSTSTVTTVSSTIPTTTKVTVSTGKTTVLISSTHKPLLTSTLYSVSTTINGTTVKVGDFCDLMQCPKHADCVTDSCSQKRCRCVLGYATSPDETECWKLSALGETCNKGRICQGPYTQCSDDGICECKEDYERSDTGRWCRLKKTWFIDFPLIGEECSGGFFSDCYMEFEQECRDGRCHCKEGLRAAGPQDRYAIFPSISQCRNATLSRGQREKDLCKNQLRSTLETDVYQKAKKKIRRIQGAIIGGCVGFVALVGILIGIFVLIRWKRKGRRRNILDTSSTTSTDGQSSRYSFKIPRPFATYDSRKEYDSTQITYPDPFVEHESTSQKHPDVLNGTEIQEASTSFSTRTQQKELSDESL